MKLPKFLIAAFAVFLLGISAMYAGINRPSFREPANAQNMPSTQNNVDECPAK